MQIGEVLFLKTKGKSQFFVTRGLIGQAKKIFICAKLHLR
jgi:hypothetical protein